MWIWKSIGRGETIRIYFNIVSVISSRTIKSKSFSQTCINDDFTNVRLIHDVINSKNNVFKLCR